MQPVPQSPDAAVVFATIDGIYRRESRRVFATLIRLLGNFGIDEKALHDAFKSAVEQWPRIGIPHNPLAWPSLAWLLSAGRFKAVDGICRHARFTSLNGVDGMAETILDDASAWDESQKLEDDRLRLMFTCRHPSLAPDAQVALTLREVRGLTTEEIARAFLPPAPTLAQRIVRATSKIRAARIPYRVPKTGELPAPLDSVLRVIYLVFNEGYSAPSGASLTRHDLSHETIRLARLL